MPRKKQPKPKPETELRLEALQESFLTNGGSESAVYHEYFSLLKVYARSLTLKEIKNKVYLPPERVEEVAVEATLKLLNQYRKEDWKVWGSFGGALRWKIVEALYQDAKEDDTQSLNSLIGDSTQELGDIMTKIGAEPVLSSSMISLDPQELLIEKDGFREVKTILDDSREVLPYYMYFKLLIFLLQTFRRSKSRHTSAAFRELYITDKKTADAFDMVLLEIRERLMHYA